MSQYNSRCVGMPQFVYFKAFVTLLYTFKLQQHLIPDSLRTKEQIWELLISLEKYLSDGYIPVVSFAFLPYMTAWLIMTKFRVIFANETRKLKPKINIEVV